MNRKLKKLNFVFRLFELIPSYGRSLSLVFIGSIFVTLLSLVPTYLMMPLIDKALVPSPPISLNDRIITLHLLIVLLVVVYALETAVKSIIEYRQDWLIRRIGVSLRRRLYLHLQKISFKFYNLDKAGSFHPIICYDTQHVPYFFVYDLVQLLSLAVMFFGMGAVLFYLEWRLALFLLIPVPLFILVSHQYGERLAMSYRKIFKKMSNISTMVFNAIEGIITVKTSVAEERELTRFEKVNTDYCDEALYCAKLSFLYLPALGLILIFGGIFIRWFGGMQVIRGELTLGGMMVFVGYAWQLYGPVRRVNSIFRKSRSTLVAAERIFGLLDKAREDDQAADLIVLPRLKGEVRFDNVSFAYDGKKNVLNNISLEVHPGEITGIFGQGRSGKTTLMYLLCRLLEPSGGAIFVDGHDIRSVKLESLRSQIGMALQDTVLFYGTIAVNIAYDNPNASKIEIVNAANAAGAHDFIVRLPDAYDTMLGEGGLVLSAGERQRIAIARVLLKNARIVIFDEATSAVDLITQEIIQTAIKNLKKENRTVFIVSNQFSVMEMVDRLIFIDQGNIVESGTHSDLINPEGAFSRFIHRKMEEEFMRRSLDFYVL